MRTNRSPYDYDYQRNHEPFANLGEYWAVVDPMSGHWQMYAGMQRQLFLDRIGADTLAAFDIYLAGETYKGKADAYLIAVETWNKAGGGLSAEALAYAAGILGECGCTLPEQSCPACRMAASAGQSLSDIF